MERDEGEAEQIEEAAAQRGGPRFVSMGAATNAQMKGLTRGGAGGAALGIVLALPLAFLPLGMPIAGRLLLVAIVGALAGGTAGAVYFGGRQPELDGETVDADGRPSVGSIPREERNHEHGAA